MSYYFKNLPATYDPDEDFDENDILTTTIKKGREQAENSSDDEISSLSFDALKKAEAQMENEDRSKRSRERKPKNLEKPDFRNRLGENLEKKVARKEDQQPKMFAEESFEESSSDSSSDEEGLFEEEDSGTNRNGSSKRKNKKGKHAPTEQSAKRRVSKIRHISGLDVPKTMNSNLYQDVRFDKSMGKSENYEEIRKRYKFLDEYRQREVDEMNKMLKDRKFLSKIGDDEKEEMEQSLRSTKSRLQSLQNRDLERQIVKEYQDKVNEGNKGKFYLKDSEKRKVIQKWKFDHMKAKQREKVMDRKRKKRLGKEFKQFEFHSR